MKRLFVKDNKYNICLFSCYLVFLIVLYFSLEVHDSLLAYNKIDIDFSYFYLQPITFIVIGLLVYIFLRIIEQLEQYLEVFIFNAILILAILWSFSPSVIFISSLTKHLEILCVLPGLLIGIKIKIIYNWHRANKEKRNNIT